MMESPRPAIYEFDDFRLDVRKRQLWHDGALVKLTSKAFELLLVLIAGRAQVLEKEQLLSLLWPDSVVEENNLNVHISALRKALGENLQERRYILTMPGRGYRFVAEVRELAAEQSALLVASYTRSRVTVEAETEEEDAAPNSLAVLPFRLLGRNEADEYLGLGLADALITHLSNLRQIIVRPTSAICRFVRPDQDGVAVGRELQVDAVLEGSVQRAGERVRVTVQLVSVASGAPLWAGTFDERFTDLFAVEDSISAQVSRTLLRHLSGEQQQQLLRHDTTNPEAYQRYLKGVYYTNKGTKEGAQKGIELFQQAIAYDPNYARAYAGLADSWCWLSHLFIDPKQALPHAKAAALKAIELDETLAEAHLALGLVKMWSEWAWDECAQQFQRAIELNPHLAAAHLWYAYYLAAMGNFEAGFAEAELALALDPLSLNHNLMTGWMNYFARQFDRALAQFRAIAELEPNYFAAYWGLGWTRIQQGRYDEAIAELQHGLNAGGGTEVTAALSHAYAKAGHPEDARRLLAELHELTKQRYVSPFYFALAHIGLGEIEETFVALEQAYQDHFEWLVHCAVDPVWDPLHNDARFAALLRRIGFRQ